MNFAVKLKELDDKELEGFMEFWLDRKKDAYWLVEGLGGASDKGRDVVGFVTAARHEGPWDLLQCKRKTKGAALGLSEALGELGKIFHHHVEGAYLTLPRRYVFVAPRGVAGSLADLLRNPSLLKEELLQGWDKYCRTKIAARPVELSPEIVSAIEGFDFERVEHLNEKLLVKDPDAKPALIKFLNAVPDEAPAGVVTEEVQAEEIEYIGQLCEVYSDACGTLLTCAREVQEHPEFGDQLRDQRVRFFDAAAFKRFHRDNTPKDMLVAFEKGVYHGVVDVHRQQKDAALLQRLNEVMKHASAISISLGGRHVGPPVTQGMCHHFVNDNLLQWKR